MSRRERTAAGELWLSTGALLVSLFLAGCAPSRSAGSPVASCDPRKEECPIVDVDLALAPAPHFVLDGKPFCFYGANNYYLGYESRQAVTSLLDTAVKMNLKVVRTWSFLDRGSLDGAVKNVHGEGHKNGVYFQYFDSSSGRPSYNEGETGLERLDFLLHEARARGLKLILTLTNNWQDFGGMDQYLAWFGLKHHHEFYTDERARQAYRDWAVHLLTRKNSIDGVVYLDDPAIFAWELANEPRLTSTSTGLWEGNRDPSVITKWAAEMSSFIKSLDPNHLVSVGDEGFFNRGGGDKFYDAEGGVDHEALTALPSVDFGTFHLYLDHWDRGVDFGIRYIDDHAQVARTLRKPTILEEYGIKVQRSPRETGAVERGWFYRHYAYESFHRAALRRGVSGSVFWMLADQVNGRPYPDYDQFAVYASEPTGSLLQNQASQFAHTAQACGDQKGGRDADHHDPASSGYVSTFAPSLP